MRYDTKYQDDIKEVIRRIPHIELLYGKSVLITGANGMVCSPIVELLDYLNKKEGAKIKIYLAGRSEKRIASRFSSQHIEYSYVQYDATTVNKLAIDADYIIEGASNANPIKYAREPVETLLGNVLGLNSILSMARCNGKGRIVYISSSEVYGKRMTMSHLRKTCMALLIFFPLDHAIQVENEQPKLYVHHIMMNMVLSRRL